MDTFDLFIILFVFDIVVFVETYYILNCHRYRDPFTANLIATFVVGTLSSVLIFYFVSETTLYQLPDLLKANQFAVYGLALILLVNLPVFVINHTIRCLITRRLC